MRRGVGQEGTHFFGRGQHAQHVEVDAPDEFSVGAELGRPDPHLVELLEDGLVDHVVSGNLGLDKARNVDQVGQPDVGHEVQVMGDDRDFAARLEANVAVGVDLGDRRGWTNRSSRSASRRGRCLSAPWTRTTTCWVVAGAVSTRVSGKISSRTAAGAAGIVLGPFLDPIVKEFIDSWNRGSAAGRPRAESVPGVSAG